MLKRILLVQFFSLSAAASQCTTGNEVIGLITGKIHCLPNVNFSMPQISSDGINKNGKKLKNFKVKGKYSEPDQLSYRRKFGLIIPATNTSVEHELWDLIIKNNLSGIGLHTSNVKTPAPKLSSLSDLENYRTQFVTGLEQAIKDAELAQPEFLIMGMSLEHILKGKNPISKVMEDTKQITNIPWATWHDAADAALKKFKAKKIGIISPFDIAGNNNAKKLFEDMGYEVVTTFGFSCAHAMHIAHIPNSAKERAILTELAPKNHNLDAIVQLGTNMSMNAVIEKLEPQIGIPILGINAVTFWYALREAGISEKLNGGGRLLREF